MRSIERDAEFQQLFLGSNAYCHPLDLPSPVILSCITEMPALRPNSHFQPPTLGPNHIVAEENRVKLTSQITAVRRNSPPSYRLPTASTVDGSNEDSFPDTTPHRTPTVITTSLLAMLGQSGPGGGTREESPFWFYKPVTFRSISRCRVLGQRLTLAAPLRQ